MGNTTKPAVVGVHQVKEGRKAGQWHARRDGRDFYGPSRSSVRTQVRDYLAAQSETQVVNEAEAIVRDAAVQKYNLSVDHQGESVITFVVDGAAKAVRTDHPLFSQIADALAKGEDPSPFVDGNVVTGAAAEDERISIDDDAVYFNGVPVHAVLLDQFRRYHADGRDTSNLLLFLERLAQNPRERAREELFNWTQARKLTIDEEGFFIGYKALTNRPTPAYTEEQTDPFDGLRYQSLTAGPAIVNGITHEDGYVPQDIGTIVELGRDVVDEDDRVLCSNGLHVGDYRYASSFGPILTEVRVDPADVVTVPSNYDSKLRCCKYTVLAIHDSTKGDDLEEYEPEATWSEDDLEEWATENLPHGWFGRIRARRQARREAL